MSQEILMVGCGNMGFAMLSAWVARAGGLKFSVIEPVDALRERAVQAGATGYASAQDLPAEFSPALVFLVVKPQVMSEVAPAYRRFAEGETTFVSIAAGTTIAALSQALGDEAAIIRTMPNTPAAIGEGMMVSFANERVGDAARTLTDQLLTECGKSIWIEDEGLMDAVTAISGSGPAYVFHFIECLAAAAAEVGLDPQQCELMAIQTVAGAARLARESGEDPARLREQVTSPAGTTAAGLQVLMGDDALEALMKKTAIAARDRGRELGET